VPPEFFSGIKTAATSPYALIAYICALAAWACVTIARYRLSRISKIIAQVPEKDRASLLAKEYSTFPRAGLSAEQWIRSRKHLLLGYAVFILIIAAAVVAVTAILAPRQPPHQVSGQASTTGAQSPAVIGNGNQITYGPTPAQDLSGIQKTLEEISNNLAQTGHPKISAAQIEAIKEVDKFIGEPDEMSLRKEFGFPEMMDTNIRSIINNLRRYKRTGVNSHYPIPSGETLIDNRFAKGHIQRKGGGFQMDVDDTTVYFILLPKDYVSSKARLVKMTNSTELPSVIIKSLKNFDSVIQQNSTHLIEVLSAAMDKDQNLYLEYDNPNSRMVHELDALYLDTFVQLRPEADKVRDAIRSYLHVN